MDKKFWQSRKFGYAVGTLLASLLVAILANVDGVSPDVQAALNEFLPTIMVMGVLLMTGHTITDTVATWREGVNAKTVEEAVMGALELFMELVFGDDDEEEAEAEPEPVG